MKDRKTGKRNIFFLGLVSFFTDLSTEMVYPLVPLYLAAVFGVTPVFIGFIEGIVESLASLLKVYSGYITDRFQKKKALAFAGYAGGAIYKILLILATSWVGVLIARIIDRTGKGIRTTPRDVLISESADKKSFGKAFGLHKALDMAGASLGIFIVFLLLTSGVTAFRTLFMASIIPAVFGLAMFIFIKEKKNVRQTTSRQNFLKSFRNLDKRLKIYLFVVLIFTLGSSSKIFLLLRAQYVGFGDSSVVLLYLVYTITCSILAFPLGKLSDRIGRKALLVMGYMVFAIVYLGFAVSLGQAFIAVMFILFGAYTAMIIGVQRAFVSEIAPPNIKGTLLGLQATAAGIVLLPANIIAGVLWETLGAAAPFYFGAVMGVVAALVLLVFLKPIKE